MSIETMYIPIYHIFFSLDDGRIRFNTTNPNACRVSFTSAKPSDSGTWSILTLLCSRGRGKNHDKATVVVEKGTRRIIMKIETRHFIIHERLKIFYFVDIIIICIR